MSEMKSSSERALIACGMWLHIGLIGAAALAIGAIRLFEGEASLLSGLPMVVFGGMLAVAGWRRALAILKQAEPASAVAPRPLGTATPFPFPSPPNLKQDDELRPATIERG
jgi:hypothetical protein